MFRRAEINHRQPEHERRPAGLARQLHPPRSRLQHRIVGGLVMLGSKARHADPDEIGANGLQ